MDPKALFIHPAGLRGRICQRALRKLRRSLFNPCCLLLERRDLGVLQNGPTPAGSTADPLPAPAWAELGETRGRSHKARQGTTRGGVATREEACLTLGLRTTSSSLCSQEACLEFSPRETRVGRSPPEGGPRREVRVSLGAPPRAGPRGGRGRALGKEPGPWGKEPPRRRPAEPKAEGFGAEAAAVRGRVGGSPAHGAPRPRRQRAPLGPAVLTALGAAPRTRAPSHAGHEGVAGPAKHLPGHDRHPLRRHA